MLVNKRQIRKESDRFGGYYDEMPNLYDYNITNTEPITESAAPKIENESAPAMHAPATEVPAPAFKHAENPLPPRDKEDLLPTVKTRAYAGEKTAHDITEGMDIEENTSAARPRPAIDGKTKILLCVYAVVAFILAIAVIATGIFISNASAEADVLATAVAQKQAVIAQQQQQLADLRDEDVVRGKALEKGMVPAGEPEFSISNVDSVDYPEATPRTDGWDEWFDFMSKVFN